MKLSEEVAKEVVDSAFQVHSMLGPGLLESTYEGCLAYELSQRGLRVERQKPQPVRYKGLDLELGYRIDLLVETCVILELKAVDQLLPVHRAQVITYLKLSGMTLGFLINFNVALIKEGLRRIVNGHPNP